MKEEEGGEDTKTNCARPFGNVLKILQDYRRKNPNESDLLSLLDEQDLHMLIKELELGMTQIKMEMRKLLPKDNLW